MTSLDTRMQAIAERAIGYGMRQARLQDIGADEAALVAIKPSTGEILAMVGGAEPFSVSNQFNRAWQARRQPGSSFKTFVYTAAIDQGSTPTTIVDDSPVTYPAGDGTMWSPEDDDHRFFGPITLRYALAQSRNVVAVKLLQQVGIDRVIQYAQRMGVTENLEPNLSLALGTSVVAPLDMASGYATLANGGVHVKPTALRVVRDSLGSTLLDETYPDESEVVSAGTAYVMTSMLESVIASGTGYPNAEIGRPAAGKTGTTTDFRDAWFVGYTPDLVAAVWVGNDDNHPMRESYGGNVPARTWAYFMRAALAKTPKHDFAIPVGEVKVITLCSTGKREVFVNGTEPADDCSPRHRSYAQAVPITGASPEVIDGTTVETPEPPIVLPTDDPAVTTGAGTQGGPDDPVTP